MKIKRWWVFLLLILAGLLVYALFPLLVYGMELILFILAQGGTALLALPQILWWLLGAIVLTFLGLQILVRLGEGMFSAPKSLLPRPSLYGRLNALRQNLSNAEWGGLYSQEEIRQLLRGLAIDLISLRLDLSEDEARKCFFQGEWTQDPMLKAYLYKERDFFGQMFTQRFRGWFKKSNRPLFLQETKDIVDRLRKYQDFVNGGKPIDITNSHP